MFCFVQVVCATTYVQIRNKHLVSYRVKFSSVYVTLHSMLQPFNDFIKCCSGDCKVRALQRTSQFTGGSFQG